jgi:Xaa-Pro aminopeptidase
MSWPHRSPAAAFAVRRSRLDALLSGPKVFVSGYARPRNFAHNPYPFRAESHFLYFVGANLEGAVLVVDGKDTALYVEPPHPDDAIWFGEKPTLDELASDLGLDVRPLERFTTTESAVALPPQDAESAFFLADLLGRDVEAGGGDALTGPDLALADAVIELRLQHDAAAIEQLELAAKVTAEAHAAGFAATRSGVREALVRAAMESVIVRNGMTTAYGSIVTVHGEILHATTHHRELGQTDLLLADVGAETPEGWAGDVTRTWPVSGRFSTTQRELYDVVLSSQRAALDTVRPGARFLDVHRAAGRELVRGLVDLGILRGDPPELYERGAGALFFPHGIGHLLGLDVHDMEDLGDRAGYAPGRARAASAGDRLLRLDRDLSPGMCVTIEPGFYKIPTLLDDPETLAEWSGSIHRPTLDRFSDVRGIRIEDDVLVTEDGSRVLTRAIPKFPDDVEAAMRASIS